jgi:hypothetical protein
MTTDERPVLYVECPDCRARFDRHAITAPVDGCSSCLDRGGPAHYAGLACRSGGLRHPDCPARGRRLHCTCDFCF